MSVVIRAHYNGKTIVPDEPIDLPINSELKAEISIVGKRPERSPEREAAWQDLLSSRLSNLSISDGTLSEMTRPDRSV